MINSEDGDVIRDGGGQIWVFRDDPEYPVWCHLSDEYGVEPQKMQKIPEPHEPMMMITKAQYNMLNQREALLCFLEQYGVDNWSAYEDAVDAYNAWCKENGL